MVDDLILHHQGSSVRDIDTVFAAYSRIANWQQIPPGLLDIYGEYASLMEAQRADWQARNYPDDFYDGSPNSKPRRIVPDAMRDADHFAIMSLPEIQEVLERFCIAYTYRGKTRHAAPLEVW